MQTKDFYYDLPEGLIAQTPLLKRDESRLMVVSRREETIASLKFKDIIDYLSPGDCLVINDTRVMPARIFGMKDSGAKVEFLLLKQLEGDCWETLVKPGKKAQIGVEFTFSSQLKGKIIGFGEDGTRKIEFSYTGVFIERLEEIGTMPLPPYIEATLEDKERYQTVYSRQLGSSAAPTAGLHFTQAILEQLKEKGVLIVPITLHVGLGTFRPVKVEKIETHVMHEEYYELSELSAQTINAAKAMGRKIFAVGTTSVRTLETCTGDDGIVRSGYGETSIFIYPGYRYKCVDGLITNFHLPESTLLMLISAFASKSLIFKAYHQAIAEGYRFFSFGDAMLIV